MHGHSGPYRSACHHPSKGTGKTLISRRSEFESKSYQMTLSDLLHQSLRFEKIDYFNCGKVNVTCLQCSRPGLIPGLERSPAEGKGNLLQYSFLGNAMDRGAWQVTVHGVSRVRRDFVTESPPNITLKHHFNHFKNVLFTLTSWSPHPQFYPLATTILLLSLHI